MLDADRFAPSQRSQSVMSTTTEVHEDENQAEEEDQRMGEDEGEEEQQPEEQRVVFPADPLASIPSLYPTVKRPFYAHAQALAQQVKTEDDERASSGDADAVLRWETEKTKFGEQCLSLLKRVSDTLRFVAAFSLSSECD